MHWLLTFAMLSAVAHADSWSEKRPDFKKKPPVRGEKPSKPIPPGSPLEDNDILLGGKFGMQHTTFTGVRVNGQDQIPTPGIGYWAGVAFLWKLGWPRLEIDLVASSRQQGGRVTVPYLGMPVLVKFSPAENKKITWDVGAGVNPELATGGPGSRRAFMVGMPLATDLMIDLGDTFLGDCFAVFEARFNFGLTTFDHGTEGGRTRDFNFLGGLMFPIDRTGF